MHDVMSWEAVSAQVEAGKNPSGKVAVASIEALSELREIATAHKLDAAFAVVLADAQSDSEAGLPIGSVRQWLLFDPTGAERRWVAPLATALPTFPHAVKVRELKVLWQQENTATLRVTVAVEFVAPTDRRELSANAARYLARFLPASG